MATPESGYTTTMPTDVLLDTGVLMLAAVVVGVSRGGLTFDPGIELRNVPYDGKKAPVVGLDRITSRAPRISGTLLEASGADFINYEPGAATPDVTLAKQGALLAAGVYLTTLALLFHRGGGGTVVVTFAKALCVKYDVVGQVDGEAEIACEFEARAVHGATPDEGTVPYTIVVNA